MSISNDILVTRVAAASRALSSEQKNDKRFSRRRLINKVKQQNVDSNLCPIPNFDESLTAALNTLISSGFLKEVGRVYELDGEDAEENPREMNDGNSSSLTSLSDSDDEIGPALPKRQEAKLRTTNFLGVFIDKKRNRNVLGDRGPDSPPSEHDRQKKTDEQEEKGREEKEEKEEIDDDASSRTVRGSSVASSATLVGL